MREKIEKSKTKLWLWAYSFCNVYATGSALSFAFSIGYYLIYGSNVEGCRNFTFCMFSLLWVQSCHPWIRDSRQHSRLRGGTVVTSSVCIYPYCSSREQYDEILCQLCFRAIIAHQLTQCQIWHISSHVSSSQQSWSAYFCFSVERLVDSWCRVFFSRY